MSALSDHVSLVADSVQSVPGWAESVSPPALAMDAQNVTYTAPGDTWTLVKAAQVTFTTDATAGNRVPRFEFIDPQGRVLYSTVISSAIAASLTTVLSVAVGGAYSADVPGYSQAALPGILLQSGYSVHFRHDAIGAADAFSSPVMYVLRYPTDIVRANLSPIGE